MADIEHSNLTDPELHEPKGASSAAANKVYAANGSGSGNWRNLNISGWEIFHDTATASTPITLTLANTDYDLTNDGLGADSDNTYRLSGRTAIWDTSSHQFDWNGSGVLIGESVDLFLDISVTTNAVNSELQLKLDMAHGHGSEFELIIGKQYYKTAGTYRWMCPATVYMASTDILNNPAKIALTSDLTLDTVQVNRWYVRTNPLKPVMS